MIKTLCTIVFGASLLIGCDDTPIKKSYQVLAADLNGDGKRDLIQYAYMGDGWTGSHGIYVSLNKNGSFDDERKVIHLEGRISKWNVKDYDGDKIPDINYEIEVLPFDSSRKDWGTYKYFAKGNGDGTFQEPIEYEK